MAAVYTPFDEQLALDTSVVVKQAAYLNATGVHHVLVAGTTGESVKLTVAERKQLAEAWAAVAPTYGINLFIHVGANAMADAQELARHAASIKAAGLVAMSSTYFRPSSVDALVSQLADIFGAAPLLPAWYYHIPSMTGDNYFRGFDMHALLVADITDGETSLPTLRPRIPNLVGIKFTGEGRCRGRYQALPATSPPPGATCRSAEAEERPLAFRPRAPARALAPAHCPP